MELVIDFNYSYTIIRCAVGTPHVYLECLTVKSEEASLLPTEIINTDVVNETLPCKTKNSASGVLLKLFYRHATFMATHQLYISEGNRLDGTIPHTHALQLKALTDTICKSASCPRFMAAL